MNDSDGEGVAKSCDSGGLIDAKTKALEIFGTDDFGIIAGMLKTSSHAVYEPLWNPITVIEGNTVDDRWKVYLCSQYYTGSKMIIVDLLTGEKFEHLELGKKI